MIGFIVGHSGTILAIGYYLFCAIADSLPEPKPEQLRYGMTYRCLHLLAANLRKAGKVQ